MRIDHGGGNIRVSEKFLDRTYIVARLQQMCGKRMSQGVAIDLLVNSRLASRLAHAFLQSVLMNMVPPDLAAARIH